MPSSAQVFPRSIRFRARAVGDARFGLGVLGWVEVDQSLVDGRLDLAGRESRAQLRVERLDFRAVAHEVDLVLVRLDNGLFAVAAGGKKQCGKQQREGEGATSGGGISIGRHATGGLDVEFWGGEKWEGKRGSTS